jgi:alpha-L-rhamnosidase
MLKNGATTLWEHWPDGASHIHYFMGFVDNFLIRHVAGINSNADHPGFGVIDVEPKFVDGINHAEASYHSVHGLIEVAWVKDVNGKFTLRIKVPVNCKANVILPGSRVKVLVNGVQQKFDLNPTNSHYNQTPKNRLLISSGNYQIESYP